MIQYKNPFYNSCKKASCFFYYFPYLFLILFSLSCENESNIIGYDILPNKDKIVIQSVDTILIAAYTFIGDSAITSNHNISLWGSYVDPVFGNSKAEFLTQVGSSNSFSGLGITHCDSIVLYLNYNYVYGSSFREQEIHVYELIKDIYIDSIYYSTFNIDGYYNLTALADFSFSPEQNPLSDTLTNIISIPLPALTEKFCSADSASFSNENFKTFFKGFYITTNQVPDGGVIVYFDLLSSDSKLTLYYNDSLKQDFVIDLDCARINLFNHNYTSATFNSQLNDTTFGDSVIYVQAMGGVKAKIKFPFLYNWRILRPIAINRAELLIKAEEAEITLNDYESPSRFFLYYVDENENKSYLSDFYIDPEYFGGHYKEENKTISFNITNHIQKYINDINGENNISEFFLVAGNNINSANRVVLKSGKHSDRMKLIITYIKL